MIEEELDRIIVFLDACQTSDDMTVLHDSVRRCVELFAELDAESGRKCFAKVAVIKGKIANLTERLEHDKQEVESQISNLQNSSRAANVYKRYTSDETG